MIDYTTPPLGILPPHPAKVVTAVLQADDVTWAMTMTVQSADPDNPTYQRDVETILTGFQMLPPSDGSSRIRPRSSLTRKAYCGGPTGCRSQWRQS